MTSLFIKTVFNEHNIGWVSEGGALLGTRRTLPEKDLAKCAENLKKFDIQVLIPHTIVHESLKICYIAEVDFLKK